jgi:hypothetical protein
MFHSYTNWLNNRTKAQRAALAYSTGCISELIPHIGKMRNIISKKRRPLVIGLLCAIPAAGVINSLAPSPEQVAVENAERDRLELVQQQAAQRAAIEEAETQKWINAGNQARGQCARAGRNYVNYPRTYQRGDAWINGDIESDFVVIAKFSAENAFKQRSDGTMICYGTAGTITRYEVQDY